MYVETLKVVPNRRGNVKEEQGPIRAVDYDIVNSTILRGVKLRRARKRGDAK